ncbi:glycoside hydrolase family 57 protein [Bacteroidales bacterium OttesenSCG-928-B11]|nr:glycoside hydrolase family 57 protein [Bacteroidales bacterium OttesenSCG-928-E04]MDL2311978.1 glycoside hydrolase family 57 protein [Bacteroidales bacterium OttesenSCG-928-B11]MDL2326832.1 glycoside hydrolase family 57 protein [Bacteroidales bacterium OttesenSCG-928-A14]
MQTICFHFQLSQLYRLRTYRFFDINEKHDYFDDFQNQYITTRLAERCYLPANQMLLELSEELGDKMKCSFSIAGSSLELFRKYRPEVIHSFQKLLNSNVVEIVGNTYAHSLASLYNKSTFLEQVDRQKRLLKEIFDIEPIAFCNTEEIYSDEIGEWLYEDGYKIVLTEGAKHILGWKNPGYLYCNPYQPDLQLMLRNFSLSEDIEYRFSSRSWDQFPLTAEKFMDFLKTTPQDVPMINIIIDYETIGEFHTAETGIFDFFKSLFRMLANSTDFRLVSPSDVLAMNMKPATLHVPWPISSSSDEKDVSEWIGNELQEEAFKQLFKLEEYYAASKNEEAKKAWLHLQGADHFNYMATRWFPNQSVKKNFEVYSSPYQAFINFMNVVNDIELQLKK